MHGLTRVPDHTSPHTTMCRSCAAMGYFTDAILPLLHKAAPSRKPPIINRGTWARHAVFRQVTHDFITACTAATASLTHAAAAAHGSSTSSASGDINSSSNDGSGSRWEQPVCQVVTLGAGTDSSWFSLRQQAWELSPAAHFIELDFQEVSNECALPEDAVQNSCVLMLVLQMWLRTVSTQLVVCCM